MAILNDYMVRVQQRRTVQIFAQNSQQARALAEQDVSDVGDTDTIQAQQTTFISEGGGVENGVTLDEWEVRVRFRRNIVISAENNQDARFWAEQDTLAWSDTDQIQIQQIVFLQEGTGVSA